MNDWASHAVKNDQMGWVVTFERKPAGSITQISFSAAGSIGENEIVRVPTVQSGINSSLATADEATDRHVPIQFYMLMRLNHF